MKTILKLALVLAFLGTVAFAQQPNLTAQANTVFVGADGRFEAPPDTALVQFNIAAQEETSRDAYQRAAKATDQIRTILRSTGVDPKSAEMGFLSISPVYDWRSPKRKLIAYRVSSSVTLKLKDFSKIGPIVEQLSGMDVTENQSISYMLDNIDEAKLRAVQDAFQRARSEAEAVARAGNRQIGELSYASVDTYEQVRVLAGPSKMQPMRAGMAGAEMAPPPPTGEFSPQRIVVTAHVSTMFTLR